METPSQTSKLELLFRQFQPMLVHYAVRYLHSTEDAREVVQDVFMGVWNNRDHLQLDEALKPYLFTATRNKSLNFLRKRQLKTVELEGGHYNLPVEESADSQLHAAELQAMIYAVVQQLPDRCREIFILSRQEELSYKEIAAKLDVSVKTVENQIGIALKRLRQQLYGAKNAKPHLLILSIGLFLFYLLKILRLF